MTLNVSAVADLDLELGGGSGFDLLALLAFLPYVIFSFFNQNKGLRAPSLDPPLATTLTVDCQESEETVTKSKGIMLTHKPLRIL